MEKVAVGKKMKKQEGKKKKRRKRREKGENEVKMGKIDENMGKKQVFLIFLPQTPPNFHMFSP